MRKYPATMSPEQEARLDEMLAIAQDPVRAAQYPQGRACTHNGIAGTAWTFPSEESREHELRGKEAVQLPDGRWFVAQQERRIAQCLDRRPSDSTQQS